MSGDHVDHKVSVGREGRLSGHTAVGHPVTVAASVCVFLRYQRNCWRDVGNAPRGERATFIAVLRQWHSAWHTVGA